MKYEILFERKEYYKAIVNAKTKKEAITKAFEGDTIKTFSSTFLYPPTDWRVKEVEKVEIERDRDYPIRGD